MLSSAGLDGSTAWNEVITARSGPRSLGGASAASTPADSSPHLAPLGGVSSGGAGSSGGSGFPVFPLLASLLVLGALQARRQLRLASESCCAAPFLLIPERPG